MKPISIRTNHQRSQEPFYAGFLLPDGRHAMYIGDANVSLVPVVPFTHGLYAQDGHNTVVAYVPYFRQQSDEELITDLYGRLSDITAYQLLTGYYNEEADGYLVIDDRSGEEPDDPPWDEYGREKRK